MSAVTKTITGVFNVASKNVPSSTSLILKQPPVIESIVIKNQYSAKSYGQNMVKNLKKMYYRSISNLRKKFSIKPKKPDSDLAKRVVIENNKAKINLNSADTVKLSKSGLVVSEAFGGCQGTVIIGKSKKGKDIITIVHFPPFKNTEHAKALDEQLNYLNKIMDKKSPYKVVFVGCKKNKTVEGKLIDELGASQDFTNYLSKIQSKLGVNNKVDVLGYARKGKSKTFQCKLNESGIPEYKLVDSRPKVK